MVKSIPLFIGGLTFESIQFLEYAKVGIILGSLLSGILGYSVLRRAFR